MNSDFSYLASKGFNFTSKKCLKGCACPSISQSVQYLTQSHNWIDFGHFPFFCRFHTRHIKKEWQTLKLFWPPQLKNLKFVMLWPQLLRSISNCVINYIFQIFLWLGNILIQLLLNVSNQLNWTQIWNAHIYCIFLLSLTDTLIDKN